MSRHRQPAQLRPGDHVVCEDNGATAHCLHCGSKFTMKLPAPLSVWAAAMKEFCKIHRRCRPRRSA